ncbi:uncharacterized protein LOC109790333 isoform X2 [Cajanus cajan]|uniref:uncharacterized protein LOC109790333 isoform X2 n=1 Tax=Cajanus cajan TaxID=3821 RepID=UPI0010FBAADF|nr:uncharacterized protein LOC109790333 isoform X2 [Cajanus cajan]
MKVMIAGDNHNCAQLIKAQPHLSHHYHSSSSSSSSSSEAFIIPIPPHTPHTIDMLQDHTNFHFSPIASHHLDSLWDSIQRNNEGSSQEPWPKSHDFCWDKTYDVMEMLEKMNHNERNSSKFRPRSEIQRLETSKVGVCSLLQEQIRAMHLSRVMQEQILSQKQKLTAYRGKNLSQQLQKKGKGVDVGCDNRRTRPPWHAHSHQQAGSRGTSCGTGVFLPRGETSGPSESSKRSGKGCSKVLIPARVVQALQLHFEQMAVTSGPKVGGFPPLHVSNRDGMYSLQKRESRNKLAHIQNEMNLPREWTY